MVLVRLPAPVVLHLTGKQPRIPDLRKKGKSPPFKRGIKGDLKLLTEIYLAIETHLEAGNRGGNEWD